ncbi:MAG: hypothetical protein U0822_10060 [Anaerolineae bacterium]
MPKIRTPYQDTPYDDMALPDLGPLPRTASRKEVEERYIQIARRGKPSPAALAAWGILRVPAKRAAWDIFASSLQQEQQALDALVKVQPSFRRPTPPVTVEWGRDLVAYDGATTELALAAPRDIRLGLSTVYDDLDTPLQDVTFDI